MKSYQLVVNFVQGCNVMQHHCPPIVAESFETASRIAHNMVSAMYPGVNHTSVNSVSAYEVSLG